MKLLIGLLFVIDACLSLGCPPAPPAPMPPDASDASPPAPPAADAAPSSPCTQACARMTTLGCTGITPTCPATMTKLEADRLIRAPSGQPVSCACIAAAANKAAVVGCGIGCP